MYSKEELFFRSYALLGQERINKLQNSTAMIFGVGGVGGYLAEALVRSCIKKLILVDADVVDKTNINRQLIATVDTIAKDKVDVARQRFQSINPYTQIECIKAFYLPQEPVAIPEDVDIVLDCIDTISAKMHLMEQCAKLQKPLISCMGMGNKFSPENIQLSRLEKTENDPLCRVIRRLAKQRGLKNIKVIYSKAKSAHCNVSTRSNKATPGSLPYVPSVAGLFMAYYAASILMEDLPKDSFIPMLNNIYKDS